MFVTQRVPPRSRGLEPADVERVAEVDAEEQRAEEDVDPSTPVSVRESQAPRSVG